VTAAQLLARLRAEGADLMVLHGELYFRGFECTEDDFADAIGRCRSELIALLNGEAAVAEADRIVRSGAA
jgi:hypothetical protein